MSRTGFALMLIIAVGALTTSAIAQTSSPAPRVPVTSPLQSDFEDVEELTPGQIRRAQEPEAETAAPSPAVPKRGPSRSEQPRSDDRSAANVVTCGGAFAKNSSHSKLAAAFKSQNITYTQVEGADGEKVMASVLYPNDPKRRLEIWWDNEDERSGTSLIVLNGRSAWTAPKGVRLGLALTALERLNGRPFKLKEFGADHTSQVVDWQGGALDKLPGGCKIGLRLIADPKAPVRARGAEPSGQIYVSNDASVRAMRPTVGEILLGYP